MGMQPANNLPDLESIRESQSGVKYSKKNKKCSPTGNRTQVWYVTGTCTSHYTIEDQTQVGVLILFYESRNQILNSEHFTETMHVLTEL
jgi:hypothetical protein